MAEFSKTMKKQEIEQNRLKDLLKKSMGEKNMPMANSFTVTENLISRGINSPEFVNLNAKAQESQIEALKEENAEFRQTLEDIMYQLRDILQKKLEMVEELNLPDAYNKDFLLIKKQFFRAPLGKVRGHLQHHFSTNLTKFSNLLYNISKDLSQKEILGGINGEIKDTAELKMMIGDYRQVINKQKKQTESLKSQLAFATQKQVKRETEFKQIDNVLRSKLEQIEEKQQKLIAAEMTKEN